jgi:N utilization substance protein B
MSGQRRAGRAFALQILYARDNDAETNVDAAAATWGEEFGLELDAEAQAFAHELVSAAAAHTDPINELIIGASKNWRLDRMSRVDRNILRLGTAELVALPATPVKVVINEAVELAKRFGTAESSAFVNGVLDRIARAAGRTVED